MDVLQSFRLIDGLLRRQADLLRLEAGHPPRYYLKGKVEAYGNREVSEADIDDWFKNFFKEKHKKAFETRGAVAFEMEYGTSDLVFRAWTQVEKPILTILPQNEGKRGPHPLS